MVAAILVLGSVLGIGAAGSIAIYFNVLVGRDSDWISKYQSEMISFVQSVQTNVSTELYMATVKGQQLSMQLVSNIHSNDQVTQAEMVNDAVVLGGMFTDMANDYALYSTLINLNQSLLLSNSIYRFNTLRYEMTWFSVSFLFVMACVLVVYVLQCRYKCCIELEERTNFIGCPTRCDITCGCIAKYTIFTIIMGIFFLILIVFAFFFAVNVGIADYCQDPVSWSMSIISRGQGTFTTGANIYQCYSTCESSAYNSIYQPLNSTDVILSLRSPLIISLNQYAASNQVDLVANTTSLLQIQANVKSRLDYLVSSLTCGSLNYDVYQIMSTLCSSYQTSFFNVTVAILVSILIFLLISPCLAIVRFYRGHELMASLHAQLKVNKPLIKNQHKERYY